MKEVTMQIRDDVPVPPAKSYSKGSKYGFHSMEVGQSIEVTSGDPNLVYRQLSTVSAYWGRKLGWKFSVRRTNNGVGVWRVE